MQIKISNGRDNFHLISYNLDLDREITWMSADKDAEIFFDRRGECLVLDPQKGITTLHSRQNLFEYHVE